MALEILHKKSAVSQKLPLPSDLEPGEIALNYHADGPFLTCKDTAGNIRKLNHIWVSASAPSSPTVGDAWYDISTDPGILYLYKDDVDAWQQLTQTVTTATTAAFGTVRLADSDAVTNGTSGRVIDAAQLQAAISGYSITLNGSAPINIGGSSNQPNISISPGAARQVLQTNASGAGVEFTNNVDLPGTLDVRGKATLHEKSSVGDVNNDDYFFRANDFIVSNSESAGITIDSGSTVLGANFGTLAFSDFRDGGSSAAGFISYFHTSDSMYFYVNTSINPLILNSSGLTTFNYDSIMIQNSKTPATASSTGITGQIAWDANYVYVCVASNTWKRTALSSW